MELLGRVAQQALQVADETVDVTFPGRLVDDVLVVVVAQAAAQLLVVHLGFVFPLAPSPGHLGEGWGESRRGDAHRREGKEKSVWLGWAAIGKQQCRT